MNISEKIKNLLESDTTAYRIAKDTGISQPMITQLRNGNRDVEKLALGKAEKLANYYDELHRDEQINALINKWERNGFSGSAYTRKSAEIIWEDDHMIDVKARVNDGVIKNQGNEAFWIILRGDNRRRYQKNVPGKLIGMLDNELESIKDAAVCEFDFDGEHIPELQKVIANNEDIESLSNVGLY